MIKSAYQAAFQGGICPEVFWRLTPWQVSCCLHAHNEKLKHEHDRAVWVMYHGAVLTRVEKIPPLSDFIKTKNKVKGVDENAIIARLKAYQRQKENHG